MAGRCCFAMSPGPMHGLPLLRVLELIDSATERHDIPSLRTIEATKRAIRIDAATAGRFVKPTFLSRYGYDMAAVPH